MLVTNVRGGFHSVNGPAAVKEVQPKAERSVNVPLTTEEKRFLDAVAPFAAIVFALVASAIMMALMIRHPEWFSFINDFDKSCDVFFGRTPTP